MGLLLLCSALQQLLLEGVRAKSILGLINWF